MVVVCVCVDDAGDELMTVLAVDDKEGWESFAEKQVELLVCVCVQSTQHTLGQIGLVILFPFFAHRHHHSIPYPRQRHSFGSKFTTYTYIAYTIRWSFGNRLAVEAKRKRERGS